MRRDLAATLGALLLAGAVAGGCASTPVRFDDGPVVTRVLDPHDVPEPEEFEWWRHPQLVRNFGRQQLKLRLDPLPARPARDVNRRGEVPSSSWWEDRRVSPGDLAAGPSGDVAGPEGHRPWKIVGMKTGGRNPGFVFEDTAGARYICKFDKEGAPETATGSGAAANRLFWALGYHVPDDRVILFDRDDLHIAEGATQRDGAGRKVPITDADVDELLASVPAGTASGGFRALASRFLPGRPIGGYAYSGTREDDPNDLVPHEDRRSLRALRVFGAWLNHVDLKRDNTLDMWTEEDGRHVLRHYLVDFDGCLGGYWAARHELRIGFAYDFDLFELVSGVPMLGLAPRAYERLGPPASDLVGLYEASAYDPATWKANYLNDHVLACRPADAFWAGTILARLNPETIHAAARLARFTDPAATRILGDVLVDRWWETLRWALTRVTPVVGLDDPAVNGDRLVFPATDALSTIGLPPLRSYRIRATDAAGRELDRLDDARSPAWGVALERLAGEEYVVVHWQGVDEADPPLPETEAHYRLASDGAWRLVGILRDGE